MSSIKECTLAFFKGLAFGKGLIKGRELAENKDMAEDRWITIHPFGNMKQGEADTGEGKGYYRRIFIDDETGEIEKGLGAGTNIKDLSKTLKAKKNGEEKTGEEKPKSRFPNYKAPEKKAEEAKHKAEEVKKTKDYAKEVTDFIKEREEENLTPHANHWGSMTKPVTSILDKEYYKEFKDRIGAVLSKLNGKNEWEEQAVKYLKDNMRSIIASYSDETQRKNSMWGTDRGDDLDPDERRSKARIEKQLAEIERYLKNPEDYEKRVAAIPEQRKNILSDLDLRFKALTKLPNDRGTNTYLSKLSSITEKLRKTGQYDITPDVTPKDDKEWKHHDKWYPTSYLTGVEDIRDEALKLINSVDKNPKYADIIENAKQGEFVDNRIKATEEQIERAKEKEENNS